MSGQQDLHGYSGPLKVSYGGPLTNIGKDFLEVGRQYDPNRGFTDDPNDLYHCDVYGVSYASTILAIQRTDILTRWY